jgi:Tfp pilus assembly protein PilO
MGTRPDRLWIFAGVVGVVLLIAGTWFLLISGTKTDTSDLKQRAADRQNQLIVQRREIADLATQQKRLVTYKKTLAAYRAALPDDPGLSDFLRQIQDSDDEVDVKVTNISVSEPSQAEGSPMVFSLPITVSADGSAINLGRFLDRLQHVQPRAVLIKSAGVSGGSDEGSTGDMTMNIQMTAFVAPASGEVPTISTTK